MSGGGRARILWRGRPRRESDRGGACKLAFVALLPRSEAAIGWRDAHCFLSTHRDTLKQTGAGGYQQQQQYGSAQPTAQAGPASYGQQTGGYGASSYQPQAQVHTGQLLRERSNGACMLLSVVHIMPGDLRSTCMHCSCAVVCSSEKGDKWLKAPSFRALTRLQQGGYQAAGQQQASAYGQRPGGGAPATGYGQQAAAGSTTAYGAQGSYGQVCGLGFAAWQGFASSPWSLQAVMVGGQLLVMRNQATLALDSAHALLLSLLLSGRPSTADRQCVCCAC